MMRGLQERPVDAPRGPPLAGMLRGLAPESRGIVAREPFRDKALGLRGGYRRGLRAGPCEQPLRPQAAAFVDLAQAEGTPVCVEQRDRARGAEPAVHRLPLP